MGTLRLAFCAAARAPRPHEKGSGARRARGLTPLHAIFGAGAYPSPAGDSSSSDRSTRRPLRLSVSGPTMPAASSSSISRAARG